MSVFSCFLHMTKGLRNVWKKDRCENCRTKWHLKISWENKIPVDVWSELTCLLLLTGVVIACIYSSKKKKKPGTPLNPVIIWWQGSHLNSTVSQTRLVPVPYINPTCVHHFLEQDCLAYDENMYQHVPKLRNMPWISPLFSDNVSTRLSSSRQFGNLSKS